MFIRSLMDKDVVYRKGGLAWIIKAGTVTFIDEVKVSARELKGLYGSRIIVVSQDAKEDKIAEPIIKKQQEKIGDKPATTVLDETLIDDIIAQIEAEEDEDNTDRDEEKGSTPAICSIDGKCETYNDENLVVKLDVDVEAEKVKLEELKANLEAEIKAKMDSTENKKEKKEDKPVIKVTKVKTQATTKPRARRGRKAKSK